MQEYLKFYIGGQWVEAAGTQQQEVINPATETAVAQIAMGSNEDVSRAVSAARTAFPSFVKWTVAERVELFENILAEFEKRYEDMVNAITLEIGAPEWLSRSAQAACGIGHFKVAIEVLKNFQWQRQEDGFLVSKEAIGVCGMITPWNWPIHQICCKVAPAMATGCTMILKPSEIAPINALLLAEILHSAGVPAGVFNLVNGDGPMVGTALSTHPDIHMMSFTGSTRAGVLVAKSAAETVKRVSQELGGKSANIVLEDADLEQAVASNVKHVFTNSGQSCNAPTRLLVPANRHADAIDIARKTTEGIKTGDPTATDTYLGPVVSAAQFDKIQALIQQGIDEGATLVVGGTGRPEGLTRGYYVRPTVFADVDNSMTIAREEIFGPVFSITPYATEEQAIAIANDSIYGLAGYVQSGNLDHAIEVASQIRAGTIHINGANGNFFAPFGGYKHSGNGREFGEAGFEEFLETKSILLPAKAS